MRASTSRACGSVCSVGTAAPPTNSPRSSPASTTARTRFTPCTGARSEPTRSEWTRRCAITTISTRSLTTRSWSGGNSCRGARGDPAMSLNPVDRSLLRLLLYYVLLVAGTIVLARYVPAVRRAVSLEGPPPGITAKELRKALEEGGSATGEAMAARPTPATTTALAMIGALALVIPVARVYMLTKQRQGYDPSVVQTVILLPVAVAGIVAVVQNSLDARNGDRQQNHGLHDRRVVPLTLLGEHVHPRDRDHERQGADHRERGGGGRGRSRRGCFARCATPLFQRLTQFLGGDPGRLPLERDGAAHGGHVARQHDGAGHEEDVIEQQPQQRAIDGIEAHRWVTPCTPAGIPAGPASGR